MRNAVGEPLPQYLQRTKSITAVFRAITETLNESPTIANRRGKGTAQSLPGTKPRSQLCCSSQESGAGHGPHHTQGGARHAGGHELRSTRLFQAWGLGSTTGNGGHSRLSVPTGMWTLAAKSSSCSENEPGIKIFEENEIKCSYLKENKIQRIRYD